MFDNEGGELWAFLFAHMALVILWIGNKYQNVIFLSPCHIVVACTTCKNTIQYQLGQQCWKSTCSSI